MGFGGRLDVRGESVRVYTESLVSGLRDKMEVVPSAVIRNTCGACLGKVRNSGLDILIGDVCMICRVNHWAKSSVFSLDMRLQV